MNAGVLTRDPAPGALSIGTRPFVRASVAGDIMSPIAASDVNVRIAGVDAVVSGLAQPGFDATFLANASFGVDVSVRPRAPLADDSWQSVRVRAQTVDDGWSFRTVESMGPRLIGVTPALGTDGQPDYPRVQFDVVDDTSAVRKRTLQSEANDGVLAASQLSSASIDFTHALGQCVEISGTPAFIIAIIGPHIVVTTYSGSGTGLNVKLFKRHGLDVTLAGAQVIKSGELVAGSGWSVVLTQPNPGQWRVVAQKTGAIFAAGARVDIDVRAQDSNTVVDNVTTMRSHFFVGDVRGPRVGNVTPAPGTRGLSTATSTQPVIDIVDRDSGALLSSIDVFVDGVQAVAAGIAGGDWSTTTIVAISGGYRVTLKKTTIWPSPKEVMVVVRASDAIGNVMPEANWLWHFGVTSETFTASVGGGELVSDDVVRVYAYDLGASAFARPVERRHTGFAWDGYYYDHGARTGAARATWATETANAHRAMRDEFPVSGFLVVTAGSWSLLDAAGRMWARCQALVSGSAADWSMAGGIGQVLGDGAVAEELPVLFLAAGPNIIVVDFTQDRAWRVSSGGKAVSTGTIFSRNANNGGGAVDTAYALSSTATAFARIAGLAFGGTWLAVGARDAQVELTGFVDAVARAEIEAVRGAFTSQGQSVILPVTGATGGTWARTRIAHRAPSVTNPVLAAYTTPGGDPRLLVCDWLNVFGYLQGAIATIASPLPAAEAARDCDQVFDGDARWLVTFATVAKVLILDVLGGGLSTSLLKTLTQTDLTLNTVAGGQVSSVAMGRGFAAERGYVFAATTAAADGKSVRYRYQPASASPTGQIVTLASGTPVRALAVLGEGLLAAERFVRASMSMLATDQRFVLASMVVE